MDQNTKIFGIFEDDVTEEEAEDMCASKDVCKTCDEEYDADTLEGQGWEKVESKYVTDESGFQDIYYWYKNPKSGLHRFYFASDVDYGDPEYFDWETENEQEAKDWFDSYGEEEKSEYVDFQGHDTRTGDDYDANERAWGRDMDLDESNKANGTLEEQGWELIASKTVPVEGGFHDKEGKMKTSFPYYWYKKDGNNRFFFNQSVDADDPSNFDFETADDEEAKSWFDSFGEYEEEIDEGKKLHEDSPEDEGEPVETEFDELDYLTDLFNVERLPKDDSVPAFKESAVNEFQFPKGMRAKYYDAWNDGDSLFVDWITQEPFTAEDADAFKKEVERFFQYTIDHAHFEYPKTVKVKVTCRDGKEHGFATFELKFGEESLTEDARTEASTENNTEDTLSGASLSLADRLITAINDEWATINLYNNIIEQMSETNFNDMIPVIQDIVKEENRHVGQLQKALSTISPDTEDIAKGETEAEGQLTEDLDKNPADDISDWKFASELEVKDYPEKHCRKTPRETSKQRDAMERSTQLKEDDDYFEIDDSVELKDVFEIDDFKENADYIRDAWENGDVESDDLVDYFLDKTPDPMLDELKDHIEDCEKSGEVPCDLDDLSADEVKDIDFNVKADVLEESKPLNELGPVATSVITAAAPIVANKVMDKLLDDGKEKDDKPASTEDDLDESAINLI